MRDLINIKEIDKAKISKGFFPTFPSFLSIIIVIIIIRSTIDKILETEISCYVHRYLYHFGIYTMSKGMKESKEKAHDILDC